MDFFFEEGGRGLLINEINTIPGFTPISMYPKMWAATGVSYSALVDTLVDQARCARSHRRGGFEDAPRLSESRCPSEPGDVRKPLVQVLYPRPGWST